MYNRVTVISVACLVVSCVVCYGIDWWESSNPGKLLRLLLLRFLSSSRTVIHRITANKNRLALPPVILAEDGVCLLIFGGRVATELLFPALDFGDAFLE